MSFNDAGLGQAMGESHNREMALHAQNQAPLNEIEIKQLKKRVDWLEQHIRTLTTALRQVHTVLTIMTSEATQDDEAH